MKQQSPPKAELNIVDIAKALSNETRVNILKWLREPDVHFPKQGCHLTKPTELNGGVCVGSIQEKAGISQSAVSTYLATLQRAGLIKMCRVEKWTYVYRDEAMIKRLADYIRNEL